MFPQTLEANTNITNKTYQIILHTYFNVPTHWVYWIRARHFIDPEPTSTVGNEESSPYVILTLTSPVNGSYYPQNVYINGSTNRYSDITYSIDGGTNQTACNNCTSFSVLETLSEGYHNVTVYAVDVDNTTNTDSETRYFWVDTTPPQITVYNPQEGASYDMWDSVNKISGFASFSLSFHSDDPVSQSYYSLDGGENISFTNGTTLTFKQKANISSHTLTIWVQNNAGLWNSTSVSFNIVHTGAEIVADGYVYGFHVTDVVAGDFDNDNEIEFAIGIKGDKAALYIWDNGSISLIAHTDDSGGGDYYKWIWDIDAYDFDHDGTLEIWVGTGGLATSYVRGYEWDGSSYQQIFVDTINGCADAETIEFCDIDGDGNKELFANLYNSGGGGGVKMWWNVSDSGTTYDSARRLGAWQTCRDIDDDGRSELLYSPYDDPQRGNIKYLDWDSTNETIVIKSLSNSPCSGTNIGGKNSDRFYTNMDFDMDGENESMAACGSNRYLLTFNDTWVFYDDVTSYDLPYRAGHVVPSGSDIQVIRFINSSYPKLPYLMDNLTTPDNYHIYAPASWAVQPSTYSPDLDFVDGVDYDGDGYDEIWIGEMYRKSGESDSDQTDVYFRVLDLSPTAEDTTPPTLTFVSPTPDNGATLSQDWIYINVSADESLSTCLLDWYNGTWQNVSMTVSGSYCYKNMTNLADGTYQFKVYANDTSDNWNVTELRQVSLLTKLPEPIRSSVLITLGALLLFLILDVFMLISENVFNLKMVAELGLGLAIIVSIIIVVMQTI